MKFKISQSRNNNKCEKEELAGCGVGCFQKTVIRMCRRVLAETLAYPLGL